MKKFTDTFGDFKCLHCRNLVSADIITSGVQNRNHCPYCLWSRHLDLHEAGDRLCACKSAMQPVGVTLKKAKKKYGSEKQGELMLIHRCTDCGKVSINRIAADDDVETIVSIFESSTHLDTLTRRAIERTGVEILPATESALVHARLFGWGKSPDLARWHDQTAFLERMSEAFAG